MSKVYYDQVIKTQLLLKGLKKNVERVKNKGLDEKFINELETNNQLAATYNEELEKLRKELVAKTRIANAKLEETKMKVKEAKMIIKRDFDKSRWIDFGIPDLR